MNVVSIFQTSTDERYTILVVERKERKKEKRSEKERKELNLRVCVCCEKYILFDIIFNNDRFVKKQRANVSRISGYLRSLYMSVMSE